ncbi:MAG: hypothetical protein HY711_10975 [Candidatus Melainabacteria bacterium]|nr:hypothetical protein [Candidatus Melainabacteria bacterium]
MSYKPYLSIIVASRNDNHGEDLLKRMQIFVTNLLGQCKRHNLASELVVVEWNPTADKPGLLETLDWHVSDTPCAVRIVQVPAALHQTLKQSDKMPLFQMIAKNVGIRRAQGKFILSTNIDIIFNDALMHFLAKQCLAENTIYRIDRYDVHSSIPIHASVDEQLRFCANNIIRVNGRDGTKDPSVPIKDVCNRQNTTTREASLPAKRPLLVEVWIMLRRAWFVYDHVLDRKSKTRKWISSCIPMCLRTRLFKDEVVAFIWNLQHNFKGLLIEQVRNWLSKNSDIYETTKLPWFRHLFWQIPNLHTNACGDFTLASRGVWEQLHGYSEWPMYSWHLDSIFCHAARVMGVQEVALADPMRIYHIEHGDGWTPTTEQKLFERLSARRIPYLTYRNYLKIVRQMDLRQRSAILNKGCWGFGEQHLPEVSLESVESCQCRE